MRKIFLDVETRNSFEETGKADPALLDLSIAVVYDSETGLYASFLQEELPRLWPALERADSIIGYNCAHFDLPLLNKYYPGDLRAIKTVDILAEIKKSLGRRLKMEQVAEGTLGEKKSGDGLSAIAWWKNGEIDKIRSYCEYDVRLTKKLYEYALAKKKLKYKDGSRILEIALDVSGWEQKDERPVARSMPF